mgnify:FL=1
MSIDTNNSVSTKADIDWSTAPEGATHAEPKGYLMFYKQEDKEWMYFSDSDGAWCQSLEKIVLVDGDWCFAKNKSTKLFPRSKPLTQAVFDGLPPEYRWAVVDNRGSAYAFNAKPKPFKSDFRDWDFNNVDTVSLGMDYDATDWQNSLIERQDVSSRVEQLRSVEAARKHSHYFKDVSGVDQIDVYAVLRLFEVTDPCLQHIVKKALCAGKRGAKDWAKDVQEIADTAQRLIELEQGK